MLRKIIPVFEWVRKCIDFFYPPFSRYMEPQFFRYGATGGINLMFDWFMYYVIYTFVLRHEMLHVGSLTLSSHIASFVLKMPIVLMFGFLMQKYITFSISALGGRIQLFRYAVVFLLNVCINYIGLKLLVDYFHFFPTLSNMAISILTVLISYLSQKHYTFKMPA